MKKAIIFVLGILLVGGVLAFSLDGGYTLNEMGKIPEAPNLYDKIQLSITPDHLAVDDGGIWASKWTGINENTFYRLDFEGNIVSSFETNISKYYLEGFVSDGEFLFVSSFMGKLFKLDFYGNNQGYQQKICFPGMYPYASFDMDEGVLYSVGTGMIEGYGPPFFVRWITTVYEYDLENPYNQFPWCNGLEIGTYSIDEWNPVEEVGGISHKENGFWVFDANTQYVYETDNNVVKTGEGFSIRYLNKFNPTFTKMVSSPDSLWFYNEVTNEVYRIDA